ncbi:MAG: hypothetical protein AVDCRST_MAG37-2752 [uncultured Rubrobacteraceae bacterium]|uniref:Uncharacterized protein n=1 Tax=uncultured Rubrobacteraceae bacterium TaxID=349277 RepID=A0A6J4QT03_9ACTN|nr:MAG: hypothetical protein AVDCRST_MAG37-2752 [uncultured Rubrobacteraceae bacterium]
MTASTGPREMEALYLLLFLVFLGGARISRRSGAGSKTPPRLIRPK